MLKQIISPTGNTYANGIILALRVSVLAQPWIIHHSLMQFIIIYMITSISVSMLDYKYQGKTYTLINLFPWMKFVSLITLPIAGYMYWSLVESIAY